MREEIYKCDGCGKAKGETNHWYRVLFMNSVSSDKEIRITAFKAVKESSAAWEHYCGEECLLRMVARNLPK